MNSSRLFLTRKRCVAALAALALSALIASFGHADEYSEGWGPQVGSQLPLLQATDQAGNQRKLENVAGPNGLLLFLSRSADW
jgi:hypothetical protein